MPARRDVLAVLTFLLVAGNVRAEDAVPRGRSAERRQRLFKRLKDARSEQEGRAAEDAIWWMWMDEAPDRATAEAVSEAMRRRERYDWDGALAILDKVVAEVPDYAEGWNQRAFVRFLKQDPEGSLDDIEQALRLEPLHFAALAGRATILMQQGRVQAGQAALRRAVEIHPWLKERGMLIPVPSETMPGTGKDI